MTYLVSIYPPAMTTTQRDAMNVPSGEYPVVYNTTTSQHEGWNGATWDDLAAGGAGGGDAWSDVVDAVITPDADGTRDFGLTGTRFATAYVDDMRVTDTVVVGTDNGRTGRFSVVLERALTSDGSSSVAGSLLMDSDVTGAIGDTSALVGMWLTDNITTQGATETIAVVAQVYMQEPNISVGTGDTVTNATTLYVESAPTEGANNYALFVDSGDVRVDDNIIVSGTVDGRDVATDGTKLDTLVASYPAVFTHSGSTNITNADTVVALDTETLDPDAQYSISAGVITVTAAGYYSVGYSVPVNDDGSGGAARGRIYCWVERDTGGGYSAITQSRAQDYARETSGGEGVSSSFICQLTASDTIRLMVRASSTVDVSTESGEAQLSMHRVRA